MGRIEKSIEIRAPPEKVWEMLALDRLPEWMGPKGELKSVEYTSEVRTPEDKYRVGASAHVIEKHFGKFDLSKYKKLPPLYATFFAYRLKIFAPEIKALVKKKSKFSLNQEAKRPQSINMKRIDCFSRSRKRGDSSCCGLFT